jgi:CBS domain-containing protein
MEVGAICQRLVYTIRRYEKVSRAAQLMRQKDVGYVVVVDFTESDPLAQPVGILSGHDIAVRVVARGLSPEAVCVGDIMTADPIAVLESDPVAVAAQKMLEFAVRRLPVVNERHELVGIVAMDDVLLLQVAGDARATTKAHHRQPYGSDAHAARRAAVGRGGMLS